MNEYFIRVGTQVIRVFAETYDEATWLAPAVADLHQRELARVYGQEAS